ncbi:MAG: hypothetical protein JST89_08450 [Cyanobacteria bacterium SZAS-4]|nr:hypothetical protein [Cyanobacteria bacterium SZAS-4]
MLLMHNRATTLKKIIVPMTLGILIGLVLPRVGSAASDAYLRLQSSRDALLAQERDIRASYDEVSRQIDDLRKKQALLDSYLTQTRVAIRGVERAMEGSQ